MHWAAPDEPGDESQINDVVGELSNMLAGGLRAGLCNAGMQCDRSTPAIVRGPTYGIETVPDVQKERIMFDCWEDRLVVDVHIKFK